MNPGDLSNILRSPTESLAQEIKDWLDLEKLDAQAKLAKALIALRNHNGGRVIIGFADDTLAPSMNGRPDDIRVAFRPDVVQKIVHDFAHPAFEVIVEYGERDKMEFPVLSVPGGLRSPVMAKRDHPGELRQNTVYMRSIANNVAESTSPRSPEDWHNLMETCFNNREADVARFLRRHLPEMLEIFGENPSPRPASATSVPPTKAAVVPMPAPPPPKVVLDRGGKGFEVRIGYLRKKHSTVKLPDFHGWREVGITVRGELKSFPPQTFLSEMFSRNPLLGGWPLWIDSRTVRREPEHPYPNEHGWEALLFLNEKVFTVAPIVDFWRMDPAGIFYHRRNYEDSLWPSVREELRDKFLDFVICIQRVAEALAAVQGFARGLAVEPENARLLATFRWTNLQDLELRSHIEPGRDIFGAKPAFEGEIVATVDLPVNVAPASLGTFVRPVVNQLFEAFGWSVSQNVVDEIVKRLLERRG